MPSLLSPKLFPGMRFDISPGGEFTPSKKELGEDTLATWVGCEVRSSVKTGKLYKNLNRWSLVWSNRFSSQYALMRSILVTCRF